MELNTKDELVKVIKDLKSELEATKSQISETREIVDSYKIDEPTTDNPVDSPEDEPVEGEPEVSEDELDEVSKLLLDE